MKKKQELTVTIIFNIVLAITMVWDVMARDGSKLGRGILIFATIWGAYFAYRITFLKKSKTSYYIILIFIFISMYLGNVFNWYGIPYFDKILHLGSGVIIAIIGYMFFLSLVKRDGFDKVSPYMGAIFAIVFAAGAAAVWEIFEFTTDQLMGLLSQNNSLHDTMWDIICGTGMGILTSIPIFLHSKGKKIKFVDKMIKEMLD
ncbi:MAG: hypothetical protein RR620_06070 [Clostridium sp.]